MFNYYVIAFTNTKPDLTRTVLIDITMQQKLEKFQKSTNTIG